MWLLFHKYLPSVLQITPKAYFVSKSSYQIVKFQLLKENLIIATYFLFEYWGKKNNGDLAQVFYRQLSLFQLFEWTFLPFFFFFNHDKHYSYTCPILDTSLWLNKDKTRPESFWRCSRFACYFQLIQSIWGQNIPMQIYTADEFSVLYAMTKCSSMLVCHVKRNHLICP